jgi:thiamine biosynthesis protein ThiS
MMIRVRGKEHPWREGMTVADLLKELDDPYPYAVVRMNDRVISRPNFEKTKIPDGAELFLIPMIAGG